MAISIKKGGQVLIWNTTVANGQTITSETVYNDNPEIAIALFMDRASTVFVDFSLDQGATFDSTITFNIQANAPAFHRLVSAFRPYRVRVQNASGADQTLCHIYVTGGNFGPATTPMTSILSKDSDAISVRPTNFNLDLARNLFRGIIQDTKFGAATVGTSATLITSASPTIASFGGFLTSATTMRIKSGGNANDTAAGTGAQSVTLVGLDSSFNEISETIVTNGASASSSTSQSFIRVYRAFCVNVGTYHGANAGNIVIETTGGVAMVMIPAGEGQTMHTAYTVPAGKTAYLTQVNLGVSGTKQVDFAVWRALNADDVTTPFSPVRVFSKFFGITGYVPHTYTSPVMLPEKTDFWATGVVGSGTAGVTAALEYTLVDNA